MPSRYGNEGFYKSRAWRRLSAAYMDSQAYICERCGAPATICHHRQWLDGANVNEPEIALNPNNLEALCDACHNAEHGLRHDVAIFDGSGDVKAVKPSASALEYQRDKAQVDEVIRRARALSVVSSE